MAQLLSDTQIDTAISELHDWSRAGDSIERVVKADTFLAGIRLVADVAAVADARDHHPDIDIRYTTITFRLSTHSDGGLTQKDIDLAAEVDRLAD